MPAENFPETRLAAWRRVHRISLKTGAGALDVSVTSFWRYTLHPRHPSHALPSRAVGDRLREWTGNHLHLGNYADEYVPGEALPPPPGSAAPTGSTLTTSD